MTIFHSTTVTLTFATGGPKCYAFTGVDGDTLGDHMRMLDAGLVAGDFVSYTVGDAAVGSVTKFGDLPKPKPTGKLWHGIDVDALSPEALSDLEADLAAYTR